MISEYLMLGTVVRAQGLHGEMKIKPYTDSPDRFLGLSRVWVRKETMTEWAVVSARVTGGMAYLRLSGVDSRALAEAWRGADLYVRRDQAVQLGENRWFIADLIGCRVEDERGEALGVIEEVLQPGGHDVYVLRGRSGSVLIPAVRALVTAVDVERGIVTVSRERFGQMAVFED